MASPEDTTLLELSTAEKLDDEISKLRAQVDSLKRDLQLHTTTLLTAEPIQQAIGQNHDDDDLAAHAARQQAHKQQCLYRACASITAFRVRDPDPAAVDEGRVLGVRFEVMARAGRFARPYFVLLNRPWKSPSRHRNSNRSSDGDRNDYLRVHRHTVPACVPLAGLAARYLPPPPPPSSSRRTATAAVDDDDDDDDDDDVDDDEEERPSRRNKPQQQQHREQDLPRFVRALRRELVRYHNRVGVIGDLRKAAGLEQPSNSKRRRSSSSVTTREVFMEDPPIVDVSAADAEAKQIRVEWGDGKSGRLVMGDDGEILKMVVVRGGQEQGPEQGQGQDRETMRRFLGGAVRIEEISGHF